MTVKIFPSKLNGEVKAIPSKSAAHRALICEFLAGKSDVVRCGGTSKDIEATRDCLTALRTGENVRTQGSVLPHGNTTEPSPCVLRVGESGSTYRFLIPVVAALGINTQWVLEGRLPERPLIPLFQEMLDNSGGRNAALRAGIGNAALQPMASKSPHVGAGSSRPRRPLQAGEFVMPGNISSQFISGLLFALPLLDGDSTIKITGKLESKPYVDMTVEMLQQFQIKVEHENDTYFVPGNQKYIAPEKIEIEGDWSNAAFWLVAGAIGGNCVTVTGLDFNSKQGDKAIVEILDSCRADTSETKINAENIPDLVPILSVFAAAQKGLTTISGAKRLRMKESDRLAAMTDTLISLGIDAKETADGLIIRGKKLPIELSPQQDCGVSNRKFIDNAGLLPLNSYNDHRIVMSASIAAACLCKEPVIIECAEAVDKSYPGFFDDLRSLGGVVEVL